MNKVILIAFIKDHLSFTIALYSSAALILLFVWLQTDQQMEFIYPFLLVTFIYIIFMIFRLVQYVRFRKILELESPRDTEENHLSEEQKVVLAMLNQFKSQSLRTINNLEAQNKSKHKVISQIVHNIKTPTAVIDLLVQNSKVDKMDSALEVIDKIHKENRSINENLDQVLSYLRLDYFHHDFSIEEINLNEQLREIINQKKEQFIFNHVFPRFVTTEQANLVLTDKKWNRMLLDQLLSNAIKYTSIKEGEKTITLSIIQENNRVYLTIEDTGIGISEYDLKRVFEPFFTGDNGRKVRNATGIGLFICQNIADRLNHQITLSSKVGEGTKVIVSYLTKL
ncbi:sensor histidine kinase [Anaerobacillus alkaliphilus]|nr:HAMP domain-containing sensor histidine kinase [Anaerobacillus alkaliphilus]